MPQRLGRYAVRRRIGAGGFATVWLAYDEQLDSPVAVKVLAENWTEDAQVRRRFVEEGRYLRRVESPHVVSVYDAGELDDGRPYLVMSYADQGTLADRLDVEGLTPPQAMEVLRQIGAGLQALHDLDILHRDIKPANVLFRTQHGRVRAMVGDLGLGKALDVSSRLTMVAGTPSYVAPEQAQAESPDARADQYSLACLAYLLLSGRPPYQHASLQQAAAPSPVEPLSTSERPFPDEADAVVRRALSVEREDRFETVTEFVAALDEALDRPMVGTPTRPWLTADPELTQPGKRPTPPPQSPFIEPELPVARRPRRVVRLLATTVLCLAGLAGGTVGGMAWYDARQSPTVLVDDDTGAISVRVPRAWDSAVSGGPWSGPTSDSTTQSAAVSVGTSSRWASSTEGEGVFAGLLDAAKVPDLMPGHPDCSEHQPAVVDDGTDGEVQARTVIHTGCPGGVVIERVERISSGQVLWVQVRATDLGQARQVLDSVATHGF